KIRISNETENTITQIYITPSSSDTWGDNLLRQDLANRTFSIFELTVLNGDFFFDIMAVDDKNNVYNIVEERFSNNKKLSISTDNLDAEATEKYKKSLAAETTTETEETTAQPSDSETPPLAAEPEQNQPLPESYVEGFKDGFSAGYSLGYKQALEELNKQNNESNKDQTN
ncbi:MAG: hypothetical protein JXR63_06185, partial [Spirochaetales bacterium]|nr:hypothetical protein [Spirochaetales bacterium]